MSVVYAILIILIIILLVFIEYSYFVHVNFHKYFYPHLYTNINEHITDIPEFYKRTLEGKRIAQKSKIVICGLCRNSGPHLSHFIDRIKKTCDMFRDYKMVFFENDSSDDTRKILKSKSKNNNHIVLLKCCEEGQCNCILGNKNMYDLGSFSQTRMKKMSYFRNRYLDYVKKNLSDYDYMFVIDMDLGDQGEYSDHGILHSLSFKDWDMISINGRTSLPGSYGMVTVPYDLLAYANTYSDLDNKNITTKGIRMIHDINYTRYTDYLSKKTSLLKVASSFNGICIYKINSILNSSYDYKTPCEHRDFHKKMIDNGFNKIFINPYFIGYFSIQGPRNNILSLMH